MKHDEKKILIKHIRLNVGFFRIWFVVIIIIERAVEYASKRALTTHKNFRFVAMIPWISFEPIHCLSIDLQPINRLFDHWQSTHSSSVLSPTNNTPHRPDQITSISNVIIVVLYIRYSSKHWIVWFLNCVHVHCVQCCACAKHFTRETFKNGKSVTGWWQLSVTTVINDLNWVRKLFSVFCYILVGCFKFR